MLHDSDCAKHDGPAYPAGPCNCSASSDLRDVRKKIEEKIEERRDACDDATTRDASYDDDPA